MVGPDTSNVHEREARAKKVARFLRAIDQFNLALAESANDGAWVRFAAMIGEKNPPSEKTIEAIKAALRTRAGIVDADARTVCSVCEARVDGPECLQCRDFAEEMDREREAIAMAEGA